MKILFVSCTKEKRLEDTILGRDIIAQRKFFDRDVEVKMVFDNTSPLHTVYNRFFQEKYRDYCVVFIHDDVELNIMATVYELHRSMVDNDIVGVAGATKISNFAAPALWHLMAGSGNLSGAVAHGTDKSMNHAFMTSFGVYPQRCLLLDGVFLAVKISSVLKSDARFDESNPAVAHFYDLDFCLSANDNKLKMTTWPIYITHRSHGLESLDDSQWNAAQKWFFTKWIKN